MRCVAYFIISILLLTLGESSAHAELELGRIDKAKLRTFAHYFDRYFNVPDRRFSDEVLKAKVMAEARDVYAWLSDQENWPSEDKRTANMLVDAGWLCYYFSNIDLPGASEKSISYFLASLEKNPHNYQAHLQLARFYEVKGEAFQDEAALHAVKAIELNAEAASQDNANYLAAVSLYRTGEFAKAYEYLGRQMKIDPEYENASDLNFVFEMWIERWGEIPQKVTFEEGQDGSLIPTALED